MKIIKLSVLVWLARCRILLVTILFSNIADSGLLASSYPGAEQNLRLQAPITSWDEAIPLGNGLIGGLLWGTDNVIRLSLDRGDLWDERPAVEKEWWKKYNYAYMQKLVAQKNSKEFNQRFDDPYNGVSPTKLPAGRVEITLQSGQKITSFELNLASAEGYAHFGAGEKLQTFFSAEKPVALMLIPGPEPEKIELLSPLQVFRQRRGASAGPSSGGSVDRLGYPDAVSEKENRAQWYLQEAAEGLKYCVCLHSKRIGNSTLIALSITTTKDDPMPVSLARKRCSDALKSGYAAMLKPHLAWWKGFWAQSRVNVPDSAIQQHYSLVEYFYGAASRRHAPPMPLQGVWTADSGGLPPWKGDYHNDLNTQMTYMGYQTAGRFEEGVAFLDYLWNLLPTFRAFAKDFYGTTGAAVPGVMSLAGQPLGGWGQYSLSPTMGAWNAHLFYLHWRYTADHHFLTNRAYPWCKEIGNCLRELLKPDASGILKLPLSTSPEIFDNTLRAFVEPNSNYDLMCLKMLFLSLAEMAESMGDMIEARQWQQTADALGDYHADSQGRLLVDAKTPLPYSHRHLSNLMGIYPFNLITSEGSEMDVKRVKASLDQWEKLGTSQWCGYSYSWMSCLRARVGDAESALKHLQIFVKAFILRNGFHANGDQTKSGYSSMTYRPFTLEGNFLAAQAVHEMLLQSWSPTPGRRDTEVIRIFPATPKTWKEASFTDLRAEGGHRVSGRRENGETVWLKIQAGKNGLIRIRDNFGKNTPRWNCRDVIKVGDDYTAKLKKNQTLEAVLVKPN